MFNRLTIAIMILIAAMLIGLVGHGVELFYNVEGGGFYGFIKALGFPLAFEVGNAIGLYVGFNRKTKGLSTRLVALLIGAACIGTSYLIQFHYFKLKIDADWWYSGVLPGLVALLSALAGLLDRDLAKEDVKPETVSQPQQQVDIMPMLHEALGAMQRQVTLAISELPNVVRKEVQAAMPKAPAPAPVSVADLVDLPQLLEEPMEMEMSKAGQIQIMRNQDKTWKEIASHFGVSVKTVQNWAKEA